MAFHLKVRPWIDVVFTFTNDGVRVPFDVMRPADDYDNMTLDDNDIKVFNITFPKNTKLATFNMLAYGVGGTGEYNLNNLLSEPIKPGSNLMSNIVVNTPLQIKAVLIEFPKGIQDLLSINKWIYLTKLDKKTFKETNKFNNHDLMARGVDPDAEAQNYVTQLRYTLPAWAIDRPADFIKHINTFVINVHCFEGSVMKDIEI